MATTAIMQGTDANAELVREALVELGATLRTLGYNCPISFNGSGVIHAHITFEQTPDPKVLNELHDMITPVTKGKDLHVSITGEGPNGYSCQVEA